MLFHALDRLSVRCSAATAPNSQTAFCHPSLRLSRLSCSCLNALSALAHGQGPPPKVVFGNWVILRFPRKESKTTDRKEIHMATSHQATEWLARRESELRVAKVTTTPSGQTLDWVP